MNVELSERDKDTDKQERREKIEESRYNREYERCMTEEIPEYLGRETAREKKNNGERENRYWMEGEERRWRMGYEERERDNRAHVEWMKRNERQGGKGAGRNTE
jgi:hypothetical protein